MVSGMTDLLVDALAPSGRGRRRSDVSHQKILRSTVSLVEANGFGDVTIDAIAEHAGVGKHTIYRRWKSKSDLVMAAFHERAARTIRVDVVGDVRAELRQLFTGLAHDLSRTSMRHVLPSFIAETQRDPAFARSYRDGLHRGRRDAILEILQRAQGRREFQDDIDINVLADLLHGAFWYRLLLGHAPIGPTFANKVVDTVLRGALR